MASFVEEVAADAPVYGWTMNESSGLLVPSYGSASLTTAGGPTYGVAGATPALGTAMQFDGIDDRARAATGVNLSTANKITVEFWLWWDVGATADDLCLRFGDSDVPGSLAIDPDSSTGAFSAFYSDTGTSWNDYRITRPSTAAWHHYVIFIDRTAQTGALTSANTMKFYVDGSVVTDTLSGSGWNSSATNWGNLPLTVMSQAGTTQFGAGRMQHLYIYTTELSAARAAAHYAARANASSSTRVTFNPLLQMLLRGGIDRARALLLIHPLTVPVLEAATEQTVTVGLATETDSVPGAATHLRVKTVGLATETDTALTATARRTKAVGQAAETDSALAATHSRAKTVGLPTETDSALAATARRAKTVGQATETDSTFAVTRSRAKTVGQASETDSALAATGRKIRIVGQAVENDTALPLAGKQTVVVGIASETDSPLAATWRRAKTVGQAQETDSALAATRSRAKTVGLAAETDSALAATRSRAKVVGQALEQDTALPLAPRGLVVVVGLAAETDTALAAAAVKSGTPPVVVPPDTGGGPVDESAITGRSRRVVSQTGHGYGWGSRASVAVVSSRRLPRLRIRLPRRRPDVVSVNAEVLSRPGAGVGSGSAAQLRADGRVETRTGAGSGAGSRARVLVLSTAPEDREDDPVALALLGVL